MGVARSTWPWLLLAVAALGLGQTLKQANSDAESSIADIRMQSLMPQIAGRVKRTTRPSNAPENIRLSADRPRTISVKWDPPTISNGNITRYIIYYTPLDDQDPGQQIGQVPRRPVHEWMTFHLTTGNLSTGEQVAELTDFVEPDTSYAVIVQAANVDGPGPYSNQYSIRTMSRAREGPPLDVHVEPEGQHSAVVAWKAPEATGTAPIAYEVFYVRGDKSIHADELAGMDEWMQVRTDDPNKFTYKLDNALEADTEYVFKMRAIYKDGPGVFSDPCITKTLPTDGITTLIVIFLFVAAIIVIACIFLARKLRSREKKRKSRKIEASAQELQIMQSAEALLTNDDEANPALSSPTHQVTGTNNGQPCEIPRNHRDLSNIDRSSSPYEQLFKKIDRCLQIPLEKIKLCNEIGRGHFGVVKRGFYTNNNGDQIEVACKRLHEGVNGVAEFLREGIIMKNFDHQHIVQLIGIAITNDRYPMIVTDYLSNGDLHRYLRDGHNKPTLRMLLDFALQIAEGMNYLHGKGFIHRDLAARNCMLDGQLTIKIADFGLCREVSSVTYYKAISTERLLPLRWLAVHQFDPENLKFTLMDDVWSYGVVLWELMTRGMVPYGHKSIDEIYTFLGKGNRLARPHHCPVQLYEVMMVCWKDEAKSRPSFEQLRHMVAAVTDDLQNNEAVSSTLDRPYDVLFDPVDA